MRYRDLDIFRCADRDRPDGFARKGRPDGGQFMGSLAVAGQASQSFQIGHFSCAPEVLCWNGI
jgi:hypothetical protein